jgi:hypothetical protein
MALGFKVDKFLDSEENQQEVLGLQPEDPSVIADVAAAPFRGIEGAIQSTYNFADFVLRDALPDYDNRFLGKSETIAGSLVEGVSQFLVPYAGIAKGVKAASQLGRVGKAFTRKNKKGKDVLNWKGILASETATDFIAFDAQEERLSNLINSFPALRNPVTEFLEAKEDDGEIEGRLKNSLEGLGLTGAVGGMIVGLKALRKNRRGEDGGSYLRENQGAFQMRNFNSVSSYNAFSPSMRALEQLKGDDDIFLHQAVEKISQAGGGVRGVAEELKWIGIDNVDKLKEMADPEDIVGNKITKEGLKKIVDRNQLHLRLNEQAPSLTYSTFKQEGGDNYREFTLDITDEYTGREVAEKKKALDELGTYKPHYDTSARRKGGENLLHFRTTDRTDTTGNKILYVEELQSDFIQGLNQGRRKDEAYKGINEPAPLQKSYVGSSMRMIIQMAASEGYDAVAFPKGFEVADLYNVKIDNLTLNNIAEDGSYSFKITKKGQTEDKVIKAAELDTTFGKKAAEDIRTMKVGEERNDYNVSVPAAPFINQYDKAMPKELNRFAKSFGASTNVEKVSRKAEGDVITDIEGVERMLQKYGANYNKVDEASLYDFVGLENPVMKIRAKRGGRPLDYQEGMLEALEDFAITRLNLDERELRDVIEAEEGWGVVSYVDENVMEPNLARDFANFLVEKYDIAEGAVFAPAKEAHYININDGMKESVANGVSMWGLRTKGMTDRVGRIKDPELESALGLREVDNISNLDALEMEELATKIEGYDSPIPATDANTNVGYALERLAANGSTAETKRLAAALNKLYEGDEDTLNATIQAFFGKKAAGAYNATSNNIDLYTNRTGIAAGEVDPKQVFGESTLLHEIIHASVVTKIPPEISAARTDLTGMRYMNRVRKMMDDPKVDEPVRNILKVYSNAVDNLPEKHANMLNHFNNPNAYGKKFGEDSVDEWYGFTNIDEFIAEAMSNPTFQNFLKGLPSEQNKNLFERLMQVLKELVGVEGKGTAFEDVVSAYSDLVTKQKKRYGAVDYVPDYQRRMYGTRSSRAFAQKNERSKSQEIQTAAGDIEVTLDDIPRGGKIALSGVENSLNRVETTNDLGELLAAAESKVEAELRANPSLKPESLEKGGIIQAAQRFSELTGTNKDLIDSEVNAAGKDANELRRIASRMYTVESLAAGQADIVFTKAQEISQKGTGVTDADKAVMVGELKKMLHLVAAGSNLRRGFGQGLQSTQFKRVRLSLSDVELRSKEILNEFMANNTSGSFETLVNRILLAGDSDDLIQRTLGITKQARNSDPKGFMEKAQNWYVNSLLSGPRTFMKNAVGNMIAQTLLQVETAVGGVFVNKAITKHVLKEMATLESFREGMSFFLKAYKLDEQMLDTGRSPLENTARTERPLYFENAAPEQTMRQAFNWFGENVVNIPTKLLLSMDEVFKQSMFRQNAKLEFTLKGMKLGIKDPDELAEYVAKGLDTVLVDGERAFGNTGIIKYAQDVVDTMDADAVKKGGKRMLPSERGAKVQEVINEQTQMRADKLKSIEDGGLGIENLAELDNISARSLEHARYGTFTNDAGKAAELAQAIVQTVPFMKFIFPFVRTPINILKFSFDRAAFAAPELSRNVLARMPDMPMIKDAQQRIRQELDSRDPIERSRAIGKLSTSAMINATLLYMITSNRDLLTGGGPADRNQLKTLEQAGWQRYSFKVGNKYASFSGLDPIGTHFGILVDLVEQLDDGNELNTTLAEQVFAAATISMTRNLTEKSYLAGLTLLSDALSDPENRMESMINNLAGGFVPNILYQGQSLGGDTTTRETRNLADAVLKKLPIGNSRLDPKRNLLGEPIIAEQVPFVGPFNPSRLSTRDGDTVFEELAQLEHGFTNPRPKLERLIDLDEYINEGGQTAHDRRLELMGTTKLRGKTLRQSLEQLIKRKQYQNLSTFSEGGFKSPRVDVLNRVISKYRTAALHKMFEEFPEVRQKYMDIKKAKYLAKRGEDADVLSSLLSNE